MRYAFAAPLTTAFALAAIATAPGATASPDNEFLDALANGGISYPAIVTPSLVNAGHTVCRRFAKGDSYPDISIYVANGLGNNKGLTGTFISAATSTLCPMYTSQLP
jgi:hypothetical protein